jgi:adenylosuccinate synthase
MPAAVVIGAQWGDEGKGKVVDILAQHADVVVRFQGGNNAGHTLVVGESKTVLHLVPSGVLHDDTVCVIGNGVVVDPQVLLQEIDALQQRGYLKDLSLLKLSDRAHLIMPYHRAIDLARERRRGEGMIGTTGRGIGPTYEDKMARIGIRVADLMDDQTLEAHLRQTIEERNLYLRSMLDEPALEFSEVFDRCCAHRERLRPFVIDTSLYLNRVLGQGKRVLLEGAQGTMLDVDHGTYPFITSSSACAGGAATGTGVPPTRIHGVLGVTKAYATRVGDGPFPSEVTGDLGELIRARGKEYGSVTGRPRRCGWFDAPLLRHAVRVNGLDTVAMTKLDVLDPCHRVRVAVGYRYRGSVLRELPLEQGVLDRLEPVYEERDGWLTETAGLTVWEELPAPARDYVRWVEDLIGCEISLISTGPGREETILLEASRLTRWFPDLRQLVPG